jgi:hypothetical protein
MDIERLLLRLKEVVGEDDGRPAQRSEVQLPRSSTNQGERSSRLDEVRNVTQLSGPRLRRTGSVDNYYELSQSRLLPWCLSSFEWQEVRHEDHDSR